MKIERSQQTYQPSNVNTNQNFDPTKGPKISEESFQVTKPSTNDAYQGRSIDTEKGLKTGVAVFDFQIKIKASDFATKIKKQVMGPEPLPDMSVTLNNDVPNIPPRFDMPSPPLLNNMPNIDPPQNLPNPFDESNHASHPSPGAPVEPPSQSFSTPQMTKEGSEKGIQERFECILKGGSSAKQALRELISISRTHPDSSAMDKLLNIINGETKVSPQLREMTKQEIWLNSD